MRVVHTRLQAPSLHRDLDVICFGHYGTPLLVFPSVECTADDWARHEMIHVLTPWIEAGRLKVYCTESVDQESIMDWHAHGRHRVLMQRAYEAYVADQLVPAIRQDCGGQADLRLAATGCSTGGYQAIVHTLKRPDLFHRAICMSGKYDLGRLLDGYYDGEAYASDPLAFTRDLDGGHLDMLRRGTHVTLVVGQGPHEGNCIPETHRMADVLASKGISHDRDIWGHDVAHHWYWWQRQIVHHVARWIGD